MPKLNTKARRKEVDESWLAAARRGDMDTEWDSLVAELLYGGRSRFPRSRTAKQVAGIKRR